MAEGTMIVIKVDLNCCKCYKKVKRILCKIPQIQDQVYDEKQNTVTIRLACYCCPEQMMQKIRCKGGKSIISIEIKPPKKKPPPPPPPAPAPAPAPAPKPTPPPAPAPAPAPPPPPAPAPAPPPAKICPCPKDELPAKVVIKLPPNIPPGCAYPVPFRECCRECSEGRRGGPCEELPRVPFGECCRECSEGRRGGPCEELPYGRPPRYGGYYGSPVCDSWGGGCDCGCNRGYYCRNRCGYYNYCEENPSACSIM